MAQKTARVLHFFFRLVTHCASLCCFPAPSLCRRPARTHRAGQPDRDAASLLLNTQASGEQALEPWPKQQRQLGHGSKKLNEKLPAGL